VGFVHNDEIPPGGKEVLEPLAVIGCDLGCTPAPPFL
jgi:hypothetical protein